MRQQRATQDKILYLLKMRGPLMVKDMAAEIGITHMGVRQHLSVLHQARLVQSETLRGAKGRPAEIWQLTTKAWSRFPNTHTQLSVELLKGINEMFGEEGVQRLAWRHNRRLFDKYREQLEGEESLGKAVEKLAALRTEDGYMAECSAVNGHFELTENHCPILEAAKEAPVYCQSELDLLQSLFGENADVERVEHILEGDRRCRYVIQKKVQGAN